MATAQFRFDTPQLAAGSFIFEISFIMNLSKNKVHALGLCSGGLDSMLAVKLMQVQGVEVHGSGRVDGRGDRMGLSGHTVQGPAEIRTGARHLRSPPVLSSVPSPFDYPGQTRVMVVNDINRDDPQQVASAYRELFLASGGGGLGLFERSPHPLDDHRRERIGDVAQ